jgi:hypothetical protein
LLNIFIFLLDKVVIAVYNKDILFKMFFKVMSRLTKKQSEYSHLSSKERAIKKLNLDINDYENKLKASKSASKNTFYYNKLVFLKCILKTYQKSVPLWEWTKYKKVIKSEMRKE